MSRHDKHHISPTVTLRRLSERQPTGDRDKPLVLATELAVAEERERRRIASGLHDEVGQLLGVAKIKLGEALGRLTGPSCLVSKSHGGLQMKPEFIELSAAITGFSLVKLEGTGVAETYWNELVKQTDQSTADALLAAWEEAKNSSKPLDQALQELIFDDTDLCPVARDVITAWYTGQWGSCAETTITSQTYIEGLVWNAANAHPMGAKQPGFGTWSFPPDYLEDN